MSTFAAIELHPGGVIAWLVVGVIAGCLAGLVVRGRGFGIVSDIVVGLIGAVVGGFLFGLLYAGEYGFWATVGVAFLGACLLIVVARFLGLGRVWRRTAPGD
jgi:uncharacterized membrane protein YeaQ/YmgE (transglycosylase-associated protein family)